MTPGDAAVAVAVTRGHVLDDHGQISVESVRFVLVHYVVDCPCQITFEALAEIPRPAPVQIRQNVEKPVSPDDGRPHGQHDEREQHTHDASAGLRRKTVGPCRFILACFSDFVVINSDNCARRYADEHCNDTST